MINKKSDPVPGASKPLEIRFVLPCFVTNLGNLDRIKHDQCWTGSDTIRASQICDGKWLAKGGNLDKIRHDQGWLAEG